MKPVSDAPLSYGQLSVVRDLDGLPEPRRSEAVVHSRVPLPPGTGADAATRAWHALQVRHPGLRTTFCLRGDASQFRQTVWDQLFQLEFPQLQERSAGLAAFRESAVRDPLDCAAPGFWRAALVGAGSASPFVLLLHNHLIADRYAEEILATDLASLVAGEQLGPAPGPAEVALREREPNQAASRDRTLSHWRACLSAVGGGRPDVDPDLPPVEYRITSAMLRKSVAVAAVDAGTSRSNVVLTAFTQALARSNGHGPLLLQVMASNRQAPRLAGVVTTANQWAVASLPAGFEFKDRIRVVASTALTAYRFGAYDVDAVAELVRQKGHPPGRLPTAAAYNFGRLSGAEAARSGELETVVRSEPAHAIGHPLYLKVSETDEYLALGLRGIGQPDDAVRDLLKATLDGVA